MKDASSYLGLKELKSDILRDSEKFRNNGMLICWEQIEIITQNQISVLLRCQCNKTHIVIFVWYIELLLFFFFWTKDICFCQAKLFVMFSYTCAAPVMAVKQYSYSKGSNCSFLNLNKKLSILIEICSTDYDYAVNYSNWW